jgi:hypothetical protein
MPKVQVHAHKYLRVKLGNKGFTVFRCVKLGCPHYIRAELVIGMLFECWRCGGEFQMTQKTAMLKKPHCVSCTRPYGKDNEIMHPEEETPVRDAAELVRRVLGGNVS